MKRTELLNHKGIQIFYTDFSNLRELAEIEALIKDANSYITSRPPKSLLTLTNFENTFFNTTITKKISEMASNNKPHVKANAVIGISGLTKIVFDGIIKATGRDSKTFHSLDEAKDYLYQRSLNA